MHVVTYGIQWETKKCGLYEFIQKSVKYIPQLVAMK